TDAINQNNRHYEINRLSFEYTRELHMLCHFLADNGVAATAFVRIDQQLEKHFGYLYLLERLLSAIAKSGTPEIEIGWHPHIYSTNAGVYGVATNEAFIAHMLDEVYSNVKEVRLMKCVRLGGTQGGNLIIKALDEFGFEI